MSVIQDRKYFYKGIFYLKLMVTETLDAKLISNSYAGSILIKDNERIDYKFWKGSILKHFYEHIWRKYIIGWKTTLTNHNHMNYQGILHWDINMKRSESFIIYSIKTKKGTPIRTLKTLLSEVEKIAVVRGFDTMFGYSRIINPTVARRFGWETRWYVNGFQFWKDLQT